MNQSRFVELWNRAAGFKDPQSECIYNKLNTLYCEPHRFYHTGEHIDLCLRNMDSALDVLGQSDIVELAIWFHDVVYDTGSTDNEERSALWFQQFANGVLSEDIIDKVVNCINSTTHRNMPQSAESQFMVDVDLSGFGQDWEGFIKDGEKVRQESSHLSNNAYISSQIKFMNNLLNREKIYSTNYFNSLLESNARENIGRQLDLYLQDA